MHAHVRVSSYLSHVFLTCDLELGLSCGLAALVLALLNGPIYIPRFLGTIFLYKSSPPSASSRCAKGINNNDSDDDDDSDDNGKGNSNLAAAYCCMWSSLVATPRTVHNITSGRRRVHETTNAAKRWPHE